MRVEGGEGRGGVKEQEGREGKGKGREGKAEEAYLTSQQHSRGRFVNIITIAFFSPV